MITKDRKKITRVAYLLDIFPQVSETFILNEILKLKELGFAIYIFSRKKPLQEIQHPEAKRLQEATFYFSDYKLSNLEQALLHLYFLFVNPLRYLKGLMFSFSNRKTGFFWYFKHAVPYAFKIKELKCQHLHAHYGSSAMEYAMIISKLTGIPFSFTTHGNDVYYEPSANLLSGATAAKFVVAVSNYNKKYLNQQYAIPLDKIRLVHCGINTSFFTKNGTLASHNIILSVTRLFPVKGVHNLISACALLRKKDKEFKCIIVGDGPERESLEEEIRQFSLQDIVRLVGYKERKEVLGFFQAASVFVLPSVSEAMPVATMEAMACQLPVVATDVRGVSELVEHNVNGLLVTPNSPEQLAEAIQIFLGNKDLSEKFGKNGRKKIEAEFELNKEVEKLVSFWKE